MADDPFQVKAFLEAWRTDPPAGEEAEEEKKMEEEGIDPVDSTVKAIFEANDKDKDGYLTGNEFYTEKEYTPHTKYFGEPYSKPKGVEEAGGTGKSEGEKSEKEGEAGDTGGSEDEKSKKKEEL